MCGPSKNCPVFVPFGAACGAYSIRPYNRVRIFLRKTVSSLSPSGSRGGRIEYTPMTEYVRFFEIPMQCPDRVRARIQKTDLYSPPSVASGGRMQYAPTIGYVWPFKKLSRFRPLWGRLWGVFDTPLQLDTCDPSKYRCDPLTGYV